jgi:[acyl-carrier-protein] S-malonyltransferase
MGYMHAQGADLFVEIGAGKVLAGLVKRTAEGARALNVGVPADVESFKLPA